MFVNVYTVNIFLSISSSAISRLTQSVQRINFFFFYLGGVGSRGLEILAAFL